MTFLKEAEANPASHRLYSLHDRYVEHNMIESAAEAARDALGKFVAENEKWANLHQRAVALLLPANIAKWQADIAAAATSPAQLAGLPILPTMTSTGDTNLHTADTISHLPPHTFQTPVLLH